MGDFREIESTKHVLHNPVLRFQKRQDVFYGRPFHCTNKFVNYVLRYLKDIPYYAMPDLRRTDVYCTGHGC